MAQRAKSLRIFYNMSSVQGSVQLHLVVKLKVKSNCLEHHGSAWSSEPGLLCLAALPSLAYLLMVPDGCLSELQSSCLCSKQQIRGRRAHPPVLSQKLPGNLPAHFQLFTLTRTLAPIATRQTGNVVFYLGWWCTQLKIRALKQKGKNDFGIGS